MKSKFLILILAIIFFSNFIFASTSLNLKRNNSRINRTASLDLKRDDDQINRTSSLNLKRDEKIIRVSSIGQKYTSLTSLMKKSDTCPSGTNSCSGSYGCCDNDYFCCTDSESGCCPNGSKCLPNFECSSDKPSGGDINKMSTLGSAFTLLFSMCLILI
ncbi:13502_t:CDS:1 [Dentiscutata erythropus]|uniref:13502_t:CDS:1 n=1 Tax=Dentiscutata erythropus TaxID=1348616 RepID=A0A9N8Z1A9_9GLOM|nr:13502_t:CDS:1 [Dentiscutata erythropus]